jgi:hypothetical protein
MSRTLAPLALLLLLVAAGCDTTVPAGSGASPTPLTINRSGTGPGHSADFHLVAGDYAFAWVGTDPQPAACQIDIRLSGNGSSIPIISQSVTGQQNGTKFLHGIPGGAYFFDSASTCQWRVALVGGPPPTP